MPDAPHFFISYHQSDLSWAEWIAEQLERAGYGVIVEAWDVNPGESSVLFLHNALTQAKQTLALFSDAYLQEISVQPQWAAAFLRTLRGERRSLIPVRLQPCELTGLLGPVISIDLFEQEEGAARQLLLDGVSPTRRPHRASGFPGKRPEVEQPSEAPSPSFPLAKALFPKDLPSTTRTINLFAVYAPEDEKYWQELEQHLTLLKRRGLITTWHSGQILPGRIVTRETEIHFNRAQMILFLMSAHLFANAFDLIEQAILKQRDGTVHVLPILLRPVDWKSSPFGQIKVLPANGVPVASWKSHDEAFLQIVQGIRRVAEEIP